MNEIKLMTEFLKQIHFNSPNTPELFFYQEDSESNVNINVDITVQSSDEGEKIWYIVNLHIKLAATLKQSGKTVFEVNTVYCGLVSADKGLNEETVKKTTIVDVPTMIFPAAKTQIEQVITNSGFPPFQMQQIDFEELYEAQQANNKAKSGKFKKGKIDVTQ